MEKASHSKKIEGGWLRGTRYLVTVAGRGLSVKKFVNKQRAKALESNPQSAMKTYVRVAVFRVQDELFKKLEAEGCETRRGDREK